MLTYFQSIVMGLLQGVTELFPVSSLGHSIIFPSIFGWKNLVAAQSDPKSFFLSFLVGLHLATAIALIIFYRNEWIRIFLGFFSSIRNRKITTPDERLVWLLIVATIPTGILALVFEHAIRTVFSKPLYASFFLIVNGAILLAAEKITKNKKEPVKEGNSIETTVKELETLKFRDAGLIGIFQTCALFAGISRSGITLVGGLFARLNHQDAARFSFLMATPIILLAGIYKLPLLFGHQGDGVRGQIFAGSIVAGIAAYMSVRFLDRYFHNRKTTPYAIYCVIFGAVFIIRFMFFS